MVIWKFCEITGVAVADTLVNLTSTVPAAETLANAINNPSGKAFVGDTMTDEDNAAPVTVKETV